MSDQSTLRRESPLPGGVVPGRTTAGSRRLQPLLIVALLALFAAGGGAAWWWLAPMSPAATAVLVYGNIDIRQSQLAFNDTDRVSRILVQEGDRVRKGQLLAELDTTRLQANANKATADVDAARSPAQRQPAGRDRAGPRGSRSRAGNRSQRSDQLGAIRLSRFEERRIEVRTATTPSRR